MRVSADGHLSLYDRERVREKLREFRGQDVDVVVRKHDPKRSLDQNAYLHAEPFLRLSEHLGHSVEEVKILMMGECWGWHEVAGHRIPVKPSTASMTRKECTYFIDWIIPYAAQEHGVIVMLPDEWQRTEAA